MDSRVAKGIKDEVPHGFAFSNSTTTVRDGHTLLLSRRADTYGFRNRPRRNGFAFSGSSRMPRSGRTNSWREERKWISETHDSETALHLAVKIKTLQSGQTTTPRQRRGCGFQSI